MKQQANRKFYFTCYVTPKHVAAYRSPSLRLCLRRCWSGGIPLVTLSDLTGPGSRAWSERIFGEGSGHFKLLC